MVRLAVAYLIALIEWAISVDGPLDQAEVALFTNAWDFDTEPATADLEAPTFTGYADAAATFAANVDSDGNPFIGCGVITFTPTNATNLPQTIRGAYVKNASGDFQYGGLFAEPITLRHANQPMHVTVIHPMTVQGDATVEGYTD